MLARAASFTDSDAARLVPTNRTLPFFSPTFASSARASLNIGTVFSRLMM
ncbi:Uncharacterised protein [Vibrio cholerae]|nr:Uncharacterised protein [Vibrio cholerae]